MPTITHRAARPGLPPFEWLLDEHAGTVLRYLAGHVGAAEAEDCFQETMLAALRAYPSLAHGTNLRGWLLTIAKRNIELEDLLRFQIASDVQISLDGRRTVFVVKRIDSEKNKYFSRLFMADTDGGNARPFTSTANGNRAANALARARHDHNSAVQFHC